MDREYPDFTHRDEVGCEVKVGDELVLLFLGEPVEDASHVKVNEIKGNNLKISEVHQGAFDATLLRRWAETPMVSGGVNYQPSGYSGILTHDQGTTLAELIQRGEFDRIPVPIRVHFYALKKPS